MKLTIENVIKNELKNVKLNSTERNFFKVIIGEFNRINDGKPLTNDQCLGVIKKMIKNTNEMLKIRKNNQDLLNELKILESFLPKQADNSAIKEVIVKVLSTNTFKNKMQAMSPCINILKDMGFDVDKKILSKLLQDSL